MAKDGLRFLGEPNSSVDCTCDILDKSAGAFQYVQYMFDRTNRMFRYQNLPDTIPEPMLEYMLQVYGSVAIIEHEDSLYVMRADFGGPPDPYYRPTQAVIANPALGFSDTFKIINHLPPFSRTQWDTMPKCIRFLNDSQIMGLLPLFTRYASQMTENDISIRCAQINLRQQTVISAENGPELESAQAYLQGLENGKIYAIGKRAFLEGINVTNASQGQSNTVMQLIELQQYLKASWYNEIGLNSNFNMKRQYVSSEEINSSADIMLPLIDNMFECRKQAVDIINKTFGTNIIVEKDSAWETKQLQSDLSVVPEDANYPEQEANLETEDEEIQKEGDENEPDSSQLDEQENIGDEEVQSGGESGTTDVEQEQMEDSGSSQENETNEEIPEQNVNVTIVLDSEEVDISEHDSAEEGS